MAASPTRCVVGAATGGRMSLRKCWEKTTSSSSSAPTSANRMATNFVTTAGWAPRNTSDLNHAHDGESTENFPSLTSRYWQYFQPPTTMRWAVTGGVHQNGSRLGPPLHPVPGQQDVQRAHPETEVYICKVKQKTLQLLMKLSLFLLL